MALTSKDVASRAGVSQTTVSRVIRGDRYVAPDTRTHVLAVMEEMGYVSNSGARAMRTARSGSIGIVTSEIQNPYFPVLLDELTRAANAAGLHAVVWNDASDESELASKALASGAVDGVIFTTAREGMTGMERLAASGAPVVLCNRAPLNAEADVVMTDHAEAARQAARYLVGHGRRRIAAVYGASNTFASALRRNAFESEIAALGVELPDAMTRQGVTSYEAGHDAVADLLCLGPDVDAVFGSSDVLAFGALEALRAAGCRVPEDVWVMGIDGLHSAEWGIFDLTTMEQDVAAIARDTVATLSARIDDPTMRRQVRLHPSRLVVRGSTAHAE